MKHCGLCQGLFNGSESLIDHLAQMHSESPSTCGISTCPRIKNSRSLLRHLNTSSAHLSSQFKCRCGYTNGRKDKFREHCMKNRCVGALTYRCSCAASYLSSTQRDLFLAHLDQCGKRKRGRPRTHTLEYAEVDKR
ncbi:hypothetical protein F4821DRAFT_142590 [Hypoxylon rubiginosum]|uniref:Uncharacterized protein n=1 Tax=Hypoxylon rubiginosum TaxID=110542 RepID=A0ACC0D0B6_9PEZI|nr:hypothetical protein F4821DRAFT_142590 [Hypoxylon rubiginosum]